MSDMLFRSEYKGWKIDMAEKADENGNQFFSVEDGNMGFPSLLATKKYINETHFADEKKTPTAFKPGLAIDLDGDVSEYSVGAHVPCTSRYSWDKLGEYWVKTKSGKRFKVSANRLYADNAKNRAIAKELLAINKQMDALEDKRSNTHDKLEVFTK